MVTTGPDTAMGLPTTFTRSPFCKRAFTMGLLSSRRLPRGARILSTAIRICSEDLNTRSVSLITPARSKKTESHPLTMTSVMVGSSSSGWSGPRPKISSSTSRISRSRDATSIRS